MESLQQLTKISNIREKKRVLNNKLLSSMHARQDKVKYKSLIFLSQKFQNQGLLNKNIENHQLKRQEKTVIKKPQLCPDTKKSELKEEAFQDKDIAEKIRMLRKPTYPNNTAFMLRVNKQVKFRTSTNFNTMQKSPRRQKQSPTKIKILKKQFVNLWQQTSKIGQNETPRKDLNKFPQKIRKFLSTSYDGVFANKKIKTERTVHTEVESQIDKNQLNSIQNINKNKETDNQQLNQQLIQPNKICHKHKQQAHKYERWAAKSSMQWIGEDCGNQDTVAIREKKKQKKKKRNQQILIPKSCLYMSMYLRMKQKEEQNMKSSKKQQIEKQQKDVIQISKIGKVSPSHMNPQEYYLRRTRNNKKFANFSYSSLAEKLRQKRQNKAITSLSEIRPGENNTNVGKLNVTNVSGHQLHILNIRNPRKQSNMSNGRSPTITIDPW